MASTNPFDEDFGGPPTPRAKGVSSSTTSKLPRSARSYRGAITKPSVRAETEPAIWAARHVEWPLPLSISLANYQKLLKTSGDSSTEVEDGYFSGFMRSVLNNNATNADKKDRDAEDRASRPLRTPRCVATANGWIMAALECAGTPLRLLSRWNVRRAGNEHVVALPPPTRGTSPEMARIVHVFVDPTGCHTVLSVKNGEAYYLHSGSRQAKKLTGFGPETPSANLSGIAATSVQLLPGAKETGDSPVQRGLTAGSYVTAVAWDRERGTEGSTKTILLGTNLGEIYEYALVAQSDSETSGSNAKDKDSSSVAPNYQDGPLLMHKLEKSTSMEREIAPVTGLYFERMVIPGSPGIIVLASSSGRHRRTRLYSFSSSTSVAFRTILSDGSFIELPGSIDFADLRLCNDNFALRTATGVYYGTLDRGKTGPNAKNVITDAGMLPYDVDESGVMEVPTSIGLTPHHLILLSDSNEVRFINRVAQTVIQSEKVDWIGSSSSNDAVGELLMDIRRPDQLWLRNGKTLVHISSSCEDRDVWKFTLKKCLDPAPKRPMSEEERELLFEKAKSLCSSTLQKAVVTKVRAEYHLQEGRAELSAKYLAQCPPELASFSETAVRLALPMLGVEDPLDNRNSEKAKEALTSSNMPLITYLGDKMRAGKLSDNSVLCTMIGAWLTELHLHEREKDPNKQSLLHPFLSNYVHNMDASTIMRILSSHDVSAAESAEYATASGDIGAAVSAALCMNDGRNGGRDALRILNDATFEVAEPFYYKLAPELLCRAPQAASKSFLLRYSQGLSPAKLLPAFMHYERKRKEHMTSEEVKDITEGKKDEMEILKVGSSKSNSDGVEVRIDRIMQVGSFVDDESASIKYLEGVIKLGCRHGAIFSYLISLYVGMEDEEPLLRFLSLHVPNAAMAAEATQRAMLAGNFADEGVSSPLDMSYALRTILSTGRHFRSAIKLYMGFGMRLQAVELALKVDPSLARELAREATDSEERKRLWLMIAKNAAGTGGGKDVVSKVVAVLKDCGSDVLSIEDVLPFLPDFAQIDQIKDEICDALTSYSSRIETFLKEMNECDQTSENLREEIGRLRTHRMQMKANARCALTNKMVLPAREPFYVFPSGYVYLESALKREVTPCLNEKQRNRVEKVEKELGKLRKAKNKKSERDTLQAELDGLIAAECPLTGSMIVDTIDKGFLDDNELDEAFLAADDPTLEKSLSSKDDSQSYVGVSADMATSSA